MHQQKKRISFTLLALAVVILTAIIPVRGAILQHRLERVRQDFKAIFLATNSLGMDNCGMHYPADTGLRRLEDPTAPLTFEGSAEFYHGNSLSARMLTKPVAYMPAIPRDPFRGDHGYYGYFACDLGPCSTRPLAMVRSVGPDGVEDLPLADLKQAVQAYYLSSTTYSWLLMDRPETRSRIRDALQPYLYDPTNGATSRGDIVFVMDRCRLSYTYGGGMQDSARVPLPPATSPALFAYAGISPQPPVDTASRRRNDYSARNWSTFGVLVPQEFTDAFSRIGLVQIQGDWKIPAPDGQQRSIDDWLNTVRNHFGPFRGFFTHPRQLSRQEKTKLAAWRGENPAWWEAVAINPSYSQAQDKTVLIRAFDLYALVILYGKCKLLHAAELVATGKRDEALAQITALGTLLDKIYEAWPEDVSLHKLEAYPILARIHDELGRLSRELREVITK